MEKEKDKDIVFKKQIKPIITNLIKICNENHMPCFVACADGYEDGGEFNIDSFGLIPIEAEGKFDMKEFGLVPEMYGIRTKDTRFTDFINIANGFKAVFPDNKEVYSENEFSFNKNKEQKEGK